MDWKSLRTFRVYNAISLSFCLNASSSSELAVFLGQFVGHVIFACKSRQRPKKNMPSTVFKKKKGCWMAKSSVIVCCTKTAFTWNCDGSYPQCMWKEGITQTGPRTLGKWRLDLWPGCFFRMRSDGSRFFWGCGGGAVFAESCVCVRNRSQPFACPP